MAGGGGCAGLISTCPGNVMLRRQRNVLELLAHKNAAHPHPHYSVTRTLTSRTHVVLLLCAGSAPLPLVSPLTSPPRCAARPLQIHLGPKSRLDGWHRPRSVLDHGSAYPSRIQNTSTAPLPRASVDAFLCHLRPRLFSYLPLLYRCHRCHRCRCLRDLFMFILAQPLHVFRLAHGSAGLKHPH